MRWSWATDMRWCPDAWMYYRGTIVGALMVEAVAVGWMITPNGAVAVPTRRITIPGAVSVVVMPVLIDNKRHDWNSQIIA